MTYTLSQYLTFDKFVAQYGNDAQYELADGELIEMEPTGPHEAVGGKLAAKISMAIAQDQHPWVIPRTCLIRPASLDDDEYRQTNYRLGDLIESRLLPDLQLRLDDVLPW